MSALCFRDGVVYIESKHCETTLDLLQAIDFIITGSMQAFDEDEADLQERVISALRFRKSVLVFDQLPSTETIRVLLARILDNTKDARIVVATRISNFASPPGYGSINHRIEGLNAQDAAKLFLKCSPHYFTAVHEHGMGGLSEVLVQNLSTHMWISRLGGSPSRITSTSYGMSKDKWDKLLGDVSMSPKESLGEGRREEEEFSDVKKAENVKRGEEEYIIVRRGEEESKIVKRGEKEEYTSIMREEESKDVKRNEEEASKDVMRVEQQLEDQPIHSKVEFGEAKSRKRKGRDSIVHGEVYSDSDNSSLPDAPTQASSSFQLTTLTHELTSSFHLSTPTQEPTPNKTNNPFEL